MFQLIENRVEAKEISLELNEALESGDDKKIDNTCKNIFNSLSGTIDTNKLATNLLSSPHLSNIKGDLKEINKSLDEINKSRDKAVEIYENKLKEAEEELRKQKEMEEEDPEPVEGMRTSELIS